MATEDQPNMEPVEPTAGRASSSIEYLQQAVQDLDKARERVGAEIRETVDAAIHRIREAVGDLRKRAETQGAELEQTFENATEDMRRELGRRAIMAQQSPEALTEMTTAIRRRRTELTRQDEAAAEHQPDSAPADEVQ